MIGSAGTGLGSVRTGGEEIESATAAETVEFAVGRTPLIDFLTPNTSYDLVGLEDIRPGRVIVGVVTRFVFLTRTGVAAGNLSYTAGTNDPTHDNMLISSASNIVLAAAINGFPSVPWTFNAGNVGPAPSSDLGPLKFRITTTWTGITVAGGYVIMSVFFTEEPS